MSSPRDLTRLKYLLPDEVAQLYVILHKFENSSLRDVLLIRLALETGARASELLLLKPSDVNHDDKSLYIFGLKGCRDREIPLRAETYKLLVRLLALTSSPFTTDRIFPISYRRLNQIWNHFRPVKKKLHACRHYFSLELYQRTHDLKLVQLALGHRNLSSTSIYLDFAYGLSEMRRILPTSSGVRLS